MVIYIICDLVGDINRVYQTFIRAIVLPCRQYGFEVDLLKLTIQIRLPRYMCIWRFNCASMYYHDYKETLVLVRF